MPGYAISRIQSRKLTRTLGALSRQTNAEALVVCDYGGNILAQQARLDDSQIQTVAALAAGAFVATRELANLVGESGFRSIFHQGTAINIYIHCISSEFLLLLVLSTDTPQGLARLYVEKVTRLLAPVLDPTKAQSAASAGLTEHLECNADAFPTNQPDESGEKG
jgi:predicted regulator of Ras-like GTPase activity (Roadblock/LC7/MglB family)